MLKKMTVFLILSLAIFILACQPGAVTSSENGTEVKTELPAGGCTPHWECIDENYKAYQTGNCSWTEATKCERGCVNSSCRPAEVCTVGFKCIDENRKGYQKEDCSFVNKVTCEGGCDNGKCLEKNESTVNQTNTSTSSSSSTGYSAIAENADENVTEESSSTYTLVLGEEQQFEVSGTQHTISIYNLEAGRVIIKVDGEKSDWIEEGGSFAYGNIGASIRIDIIFFQTYGTKSIDYSIH